MCLAFSYIESIWLYLLHVATFSTKPDSKITLIKCSMVSDVITHNTYIVD